MSIQALLSQFGEKYLLALLTTYRLTVIAFVLALLLGIAVTVMRISPIQPLRAAGEVFVQIFRNMPGAALLILLVTALIYILINFLLNQLSVALAVRRKTETVRTARKEQPA